MEGLQDFWTKSMFIEQNSSNGVHAFLVNSNLLRRYPTNFSCFRIWWKCNNFNVRSTKFGKQTLRIGKVCCIRKNFDDEVTWKFQFEITKLHIEYAVFEATKV